MVRRLPSGQCCPQARDTPPSTAPTPRDARLAAGRSPSHGLRSDRTCAAGHELRPEADEQRRPCAAVCEGEGSVVSGEISVMRSRWRDLGGEISVARSRWRDLGGEIFEDILGKVPGGSAPLAEDERVSVGDTEHPPDERRGEVHLIHCRHRSGVCELVVARQEAHREPQGHEPCLWRRTASCGSLVWQPVVRRLAGKSCSRAARRICSAWRDAAMGVYPGTLPCVSFNCLICPAQLFDMYRSIV